MISPTVGVPLVNQPNPFWRPFAIAVSASLALTLLGCQPKEPIEKAADSNSQAHAETAHDHAETDIDADMDTEIDTDHDGHDEHGEADEHAEHGEHAEHDEHEHEEEAHDEHAGHNHDANRTVFDCQPHKTISVFYHNDATPKTAHLLIDGVEYDLAKTQSNAASGHYFASKMGISDDESQGILWQVDGRKAVLFGVPVVDIHDVTGTPTDVDQKNSQTLYTCQQKT